MFLNVSVVENSNLLRQSKISRVARDIWKTWGMATHHQKFHQPKLAENHFGESTKRNSEKFRTSPAMRVAMPLFKTTSGLHYSIRFLWNIVKINPNYWSQNVHSRLQAKMSLNPTLEICKNCAWFSYAPRTGRKLKLPESPSVPKSLIKSWIFDFVFLTAYRFELCPYSQEHGLATASHRSSAHSKRCAGTKQQIKTDSPCFPEIRLVAQLWWALQLQKNSSK